MKSLFPLFLCVFISFPAMALPTVEARSAAIFILQQRPVVRACLLVAQRSFQLQQIWQSAECQPLFRMDKTLKAAWDVVLPEGDIDQVNEFSNGLRTLVGEAYGEYKLLAERIEELRG